MPEAAFISCSSSHPLNTVVCVGKKETFYKILFVELHQNLPLFLSGLGATPGGSWCRMMKYTPVIGKLPLVRSGAWLYPRDLARNNLSVTVLALSQAGGAKTKENISLNLSLKIIFIIFGVFIKYPNLLDFN